MIRCFEYRIHYTTDNKKAAYLRPLIISSVILFFARD
nr:MAG TPA: hypothetical protein [Caudoviricetes sp.]